MGRHPLRIDQVLWVLRERDDQTLLIRRTAAGWRDRIPKFEIRTGKVVTLAEMFYYGCDFCTAYDIYKLYMDLPIFIQKHRRQHFVRRRFQ